MTDGTNFVLERRQRNQALKQSCVETTSKVA